MTKELMEMLRKNRTIDREKKESAHAGMRRMIKHLLKKYKYPPEGQKNALQTIMSQCELWTDQLIIIFNRKGLTIANTMEQQAKIRDVLASHSVKYYIKVVNRFAHGSSSGHTGSFGLNMDAVYEYTFYVHNDDFETAKAILTGRYHN